METKNEKKLETWMEPDNIMYKFPAALVKSDTVVGLIIKGKTGWFAKTILHFLKQARDIIVMEVTDKAVNHVDLKGIKLHIPLNFLAKVTLLTC